jgi:flavin-dependent dehydrogenase
MADDGEVVVAGAGPAGTSAAIALALFGHRVAIFERAHFPRHRIGESLPPKIAPVFAMLGVEDAVASAGFVRMTGTTVHLGLGAATHDFDPAKRALGYQVDRARFDRLLLDRARATGVRAIEGAQVTGVDRDREGRVTGVLVKRGDVQELVPAAFVVDATGSAAVVSRALGLKKREAIRTVALTGYFTGARIPDAYPAENTLFEMRPDGWLWSVMIAGGRRNVTLGLDPADLKTAGRDAAAIYAERLGRSQLIGPLVNGAALEGEIIANDATWFFSERYAGAGFLLAGDAASFIDPLTSQGVYKAMHAGLNAAAAINTILRRPKDAELAISFYGDLQARAQRSYTEVALSFYRTSPFVAEPFWNARVRGDLWSPAAETFSPEWNAKAQSRREAFTRRLENEGGSNVRVRLKPGLEIADRPTVQGGFVVLGPSLVASDPTELSSFAQGERVDLGALLALLDGRTVADVFEGYVAATGRARSSAEARDLMRALGTLAELDRLEIE